MRCPKCGEGNVTVSKTLYLICNNGECNHKINVRLNSELAWLIVELYDEVESLKRTIDKLES
jgi:hypothetical protein